MSEINVKGIKEDEFGAKMPNVFIDRVIINYSRALPYVDGKPETEFVFKLSVKFTKPDYIQAGSAKQFVDEYLDNIYLYAYLTNDYWIKNYLEEDKFSLEYWHREGMGGTDAHKAPTRFQRIPLKDLIAPENAYESVMNIGPNFDENGNEIIEITNINVKMTTHAPPPLVLPALEEIAALMFFTYVGIKAKGFYSSSDATEITLVDEDDGLFSERYEEGGFVTIADSTTVAGENLWAKMSSNAYFGDISYYHVLENNLVATKLFEAYATPDGIPYFKEVLQSTNGKFYAAENYSFEDIKTKLEALIDQHNADREADAALDANIKNLELIINSTDNKSGVLSELSNYRATYPDKSPIGLPGRFYAEFVVAFAEIIQAVQDQVELQVRLLYDSLVVDNRYGFFTGTYTAPSPSTGEGGIDPDDVKRGVPYTDPQGCYIPSKWFMLARNVMLTNSISTISDDDLGNLYGVSSDIESFRSSFIDEGATLQRLMDELIEIYKDAGFTTAEARHMAREELSLDFDTSGIEDASAKFTGRYTFSRGQARSELLNPALDVGSTRSSAGEGRSSYIQLRAGDALVRNIGFFFFDYEKALRTQSMIAHVFNISKLQKLFRINVPYEHFYIKNVELSRNELRLDATELEAYYDKYIRVKMTCEMYTPSITPGTAETVEYIDYPKGNKLLFKYRGGLGITESESESDILAHRLKYLRPQTYVGDKTYYSGIKHKNFDFPTTNTGEDSTHANTLKSCNTLDYIVSAKKLDFASAATDTGFYYNLSPLDGYRLMCFKFFDFMDDDVAYYNTIVTTDTERNTLLKASNNLDEPKTCYSIIVTVEDQTQLTYDSFVTYIVNAYNEFVEFYSYANDICSFNNITNEFNQFFIDQIAEIYPSETPWIKAAYIAHALGELLFGTTGDTIDTELFNSNVTETILKISPSTGNLYQLTAFAEQFKAAINYLTIDEVESTATTGIGPDEATPFKRLQESYGEIGDPDSVGSRTLQFYNEKPIWEPISGDITPDDLTLADTSADPTYLALPEFAIPIGKLSPVDTDTSGFASLGAYYGASEDALGYRAPSAVVSALEDAAAAAASVAGSAIRDYREDSMEYDAAFLREGIYNDWYGSAENYDELVRGIRLGHTREGKTLAQVVGNAAKVIDLVFLQIPNSAGVMSRDASWWGYLYGLNSTFVTYGAYDMEDLTMGEHRARIDSKLKSIDTPVDKFGEPIPGEIGVSYAAYLLNRIMKYTTTDVDVKIFGDLEDTVDFSGAIRYQTGVLRPGITSRSALGESADPFTVYDEIINRSTYRNVITCLAVLNRLMYAHWHYSVMVNEAYDAGSDTRALQASLEVRNSNNWFNVYESIAGSEGRGIAGYTVSKVFQMCVARSYWYLSDLHAVLKRVGNLSTGGLASRGAAKDILAEYGLDLFMNSDDPFGPSSGILGPGDPDSSIYDAATLPISTLLD